jgi:TPR repeat protein
MKLAIKVLCISLVIIGCYNSSQKRTYSTKTSDNENDFVESNESDILVGRARDYLANNNVDSAMRIYSELLKNGNIIYYYDIGDYLLTKGDNEGLLYLDSGAILGDASSAFVLAVLYKTGKSTLLKAKVTTHIDLNKAVYYFRLGSDLGDPLCQFNLAGLYNDSALSIYNVDSAKFYLVKCMNNKELDENGTSDVAKDYYKEWFGK